MPVCYAGPTVPIASYHFSRSGIRPAPHFVSEACLDHVPEPDGLTGSHSVSVVYLVKCDEGVSVGSLPNIRAGNFLP